MPGTVRLGLTGDVMLGRNVDRRQRSRPPEAVWGDVLERLRGLDGLFVNLESPLSTRGERWTRTHRPFHFRADPEWAVPALAAAGVDCCALANNHALDFGAVALEDTLDELAATGIATAGAGRDRDAALAPATVAIDVDDERTRECVEEALARAAATDPDLLVASLHWGPNMVVEPPPEFERFGRWLVDRGVDAVHGHSAHVIQGVEVYDGAPIPYDAGDFVDDYAVDPELRNDRSFLFELRVGADGTPEELRMHPTEIEGCSVHEAASGAARWCRERMRERSEPYGTTFERAGEAVVAAL